MNANRTAVLAAVICVASFNTSAAPTIIDQCQNGYSPAEIDVTLEISTVTDCPLLEDNELRRLVNKFGNGNVFPYPDQPQPGLDTCVSGSNLTGTVTWLDSGDVIQVNGYSESAQRFFAEAGAIGNPLFISGTTDTQVPFASGAAMTVAVLTGNDFDLKLVLDDRFTVDYSSYPFVDKETFLVIGSKGDFKARGRLLGSADVYSTPGNPLANEPLSLSGTICLK